MSIEAEPAAGGAQERHRPRPLAAAGVALSTIGLSTGMFAFHQIVVTDVLAARSQHQLRADLRSAFATSGPGASYDASLPGQDDFDLAALQGEEPAPSGGGAAAEALIAPDPARPGEPVALLRIPAIGLDQVVVEGTASGALKSGPGHFRNTPMPGEPGNSAIAAHRTTYGAPFGDLDRLPTGSEILVATARGESRYVVTGTTIVKPGQPDVLSQTADDRLTLTTSHPAWIGNERLVVTARLDGLPAEVADTPSAPLVVDGAQLGLSGDSGAWAGILLWGELLVVAVVAAMWCYRNWLRRSTYLLSTPVLAALVFLLFESVDRLLPATL